MLRNSRGAELRMLARLRRHPDTCALITLSAIIVGAVSVRWFYELWLTDYDIFAFFLPNWGYTGSRLREFDVPGWNPFVSGGAPMAGDPSGGWMYLPVMIAFSVFDAITAMKALLLIQSLVAGIATYMFARRIELSVLSSLIAAVCMSTGPLLYLSTYYVPVAANISAFIPLGLLGVESALRSRKFSGFLGWSTLAGIAVSQMFTSWPGQGLLYGAMIIAGWMGWRWLFEPVEVVGSRTTHLVRLMGIGFILSLVSVAFGAAGILPRLDFIANSNISGGDYSNVVGGDYAAITFSLPGLLHSLLVDSYYQRIYGPGIAVLTLAIFGLLMARRRFGAIFFLVVFLIFVDLATTHSIARPILGVIPGFEHLHGHRPVGTLLVVSIAPSILVGVAAQTVAEQPLQRWHLAWRFLPLAFIVALCLVAETGGGDVGITPYLIAIITTLVLYLPLIKLPRFRPGWGTRGIAGTSIAILLLVIIYPTLFDFSRAIGRPGAGVHSDGTHFLNALGRDENTMDKVKTMVGEVDPDGATTFLLDQQQTETPFRYASYAGYDPKSRSYSYRRLDLNVVESMAGSQSISLGLEQVAGYNPVHLKYYFEYMTALNEFPQNYHWIDIYRNAIAYSPLLDMLNTRYIVVATSIGPESPEMMALSRRMTEVFRTNRVVVFENPDAFERAWIVHDVRSDPNDEGLDMLARGEIDGRTTAFIASGDLAMTPGDGSSMDSVVIVDQDPEAMSLEVTSDGDGLLVISDAFEPNWQAWVDGERVEIHRANHAFRGIYVSDGMHRVDLRYEPRSLQLGLWSTGITSIAILGVWSWAYYDRRRPII